MTHIGSKILMTERLILRPFRIEDAEAMFANWASDSEVTKYLTWQPHESVEVTRSILNEWVPHYSENDYYHWAITFKDSDMPIGSVGAMQKNDSINMVHIGYCLSRKWWHQGIMSEVLAELIRFFFDEVGVNRVESRHDPNNPNSGKVMLKCGMLYEGTSRQSDSNNQGLCDAANYAILACDYRRGLEYD